MISTLGAIHKTVIHFKQVQSSKQNRLITLLDANYWLKVDWNQFNSQASKLIIHGYLFLCVCCSWLYCPIPRLCRCTVVCNLWFLTCDISDISYCGACSADLAPGPMINFCDDSQSPPKKIQLYLLQDAAYLCIGNYRWVGEVYSIVLIVEIVKHNYLIWTGHFANMMLVYLAATITLILTRICTA